MLTLRRGDRPTDAQATHRLAAHVRTCRACPAPIGCGMWTPAPGERGAREHPAGARRAPRVQETSTARDGCFPWARRPTPRPTRRWLARGTVSSDRVSRQPAALATLATLRDGWRQPEHDAPP